jgi:hypothetical protein
VELIHADHVRISQLIKELDKALARTCPADPVPEPAPVWAALAGFLGLHIDAVEEIAYQALVSAGPGAARAIVQASEANAEICEAVQEARLSPTRSPTWRMAVQAACRAARRHIACEESGPLTWYRLQAAPPDRDALGHQWVSFVTARVLDSVAGPLP